MITDTFSGTHIDENFSKISQSSKINPILYEKNKNYKKNNFRFLKTTILPRWLSWERSSLRELGGLRTAKCSSKFPPPALAHPQLGLKIPFSVVVWSSIFTSRLLSTTLFIEEFLLVNPLRHRGMMGDEWKLRNFLYFLLKIYIERAQVCQLGNRFS